MTTPTVVTLDGCAVAPRVYVEPMECEKPMFGLESVSDIKPITDPHEENGVEWSPYDCAASETYCNKCQTIGDSKTYHRQDGVKVAAPFAVYGSFKCSPVGFDREQAQKRARESLDRGQWRAIEKGFWTELSTDTDVIDLNPAGAVSIVMGMGALESWGGENMGCMPTIHGNRGLVPTMSNASLFPTSLGDKRMRTFLGTYFSAGGGYTDVGPGGVLAGPGEAWAYITGPVRIWLGDVFDTPPPNDDSLIDRDVNDLLALAERVVLTGRECGAAAIRVKAEGCGCC